MQPAGRGTLAIGLIPCERVTRSSAGVRVASQGSAPLRAPSRRRCTRLGTAPLESAQWMSACRAAASSGAARVSALGPLKISKRLMPASTRHEAIQGLAEALSVLGGFLSLLVQPGEPLGWSDILRVEGHTSNHHGDLSVQSTLVNLENIPVVSQLDRHAGGFYG